MSAPVRSFGRGRLIRRVANSLVGRAVSIRVGTGTIRGIVAGSMVQAGTPRIVVAGAQYPLAQVLTVAPPDLLPES